MSSEEKPVKAKAKVKANLTSILAKLRTIKFDYTSDLRFQEYLETEGIMDSVSKILEVINNYKTITEVDISSANIDLLTISSHLVYVTTKLGELNGEISKQEDIKKLTRSRYIVEAKSMAESEDSKISDTEADNLSRVLSEDTYHDLSLLITVQGFLTNLMFNSRNFCDMLNNVCNRELKASFQ